MQNIQYRVAQIDNKIVGFASATMEDWKNMLQAIYILPEYQGKGIGKNLLNKVFDFFKDWEEIYLKVASYNQKAINFYQNFGFSKALWTESKHEVIKWKFMPFFMMKK